jgi:uncharacterized protein YcfL
MKALIPAILAVALITGCTTDKGGEGAPAHSDKFLLMDSGTQHSVSADALREMRLPDGRLDVVANVRNREGRRIQVQVNCEFKDPHGYTIDSTPWQTLMLTENAQETVRFASMNNQASTYTIRIRQAR